MTVRPVGIWQAETIAALYRDISAALRHYEAYCLEAEARCPKEWRMYWREEAASVTRTRLHIEHRMITFLEYAAGKHIQVLGKLHEDDEHGHADG